ncbi:MAG: hypothetical protein ABSH46_07740 [Bryobacteraceae bacterium]
MLRIAFLVLMLAVSAAAQTLADSARALAHKIATALTPGELVQLTVRNASSLAASDFAPARQALEAELHSRGAATEGATVSVTLSENGLGYLWVAEILRAGKREAAILERAPAPDAQAAAASPLLVKKPLWEQEARILDIAPSEGGLAILDPSGISLYHQEDGRWNRVKQTPVEFPKPEPRDLRGRLALRSGEWAAFLPGAESGPEWPLEIGNARIWGSRNYFTAPNLPPFFSAARAGDGWVLAGIDGRAQLFSAALEPLSAFAGWGSDVARIEFGRGGLVLATKAGESDEPDEVQAFEIVERQAVAVGAPVEFLGPVMEMHEWADGTGSAVVISRNLKTGRYAAFTLTVSGSR